ncbi:hypothetical protein HW555_009366 [Spodoptera exigua]|uniref:Uncharacterized protein n=1 Tax=Spodoptera exigua TaxID=7107 RepID=A0A835GBD1_SPOEX|nr:hypothetical protein HW555_009366 [Spodoptera exigua]
MKSRQKSEQLLCIPGNGISNISIQFSRNSYFSNCMCTLRNIIVYSLVELSHIFTRLMVVSKMRNDSAIYSNRICLASPTLVAAPPSAFAGLIRHTNIDKFYEALMGTHNPILMVMISKPSKNCFIDRDGGGFAANMLAATTPTLLLRIASGLLQTVTLKRWLCNVDVGSCTAIFVLLDHYVSSHQSKPFSLTPLAVKTASPFFSRFPKTFRDQRVTKTINHHFSLTPLAVKTASPFFSRFPKTFRDQRVTKTINHHSSLTPLAVKTASPFFLDFPKLLGTRDFSLTPLAEKTASPFFSRFPKTFRDQRVTKTINHQYLLPRWSFNENYAQSYK